MSDVCNVGINKSKLIVGNVLKSCFYAILNI